MTATADPAGLAALHAACFRNPRPWTAAELASLLASPGAVLLAEPGGFLLGRIIAGEAEVLTLAVDPAMRRQGMGARLLRGFLAAAQHRGAATAFLEVAADNTAARALYRRHGFAEVGRRRAYYADSPGAPVDALVLGRAVAGEPQEI